LLGGHKSHIAIVAEEWLRCVMIRAVRGPKRCKKYSWPIIKLIILTMINMTLTRQEEV